MNIGVGEAGLFGLRTTPQWVDSGIDGVSGGGRQMPMDWEAVGLRFSTVDSGIEASGLKGGKVRCLCDRE